MKKERRRLVFRLVAATFAFSFACLFGEVIARIARPGTTNQAEPDNLEDKAHEGWDHRPNPNTRRTFGGVEVKINAHGFRDDEEWPLEKPAGEKRILFLGDSFLYAAFLKQDEVVFEQTEKLLEPEFATAHALDLACPGWGTSHHKVVLERFGLATKPDVVVLCFFVGNDVMETHALHDRWFVDPDHALGTEKKTLSLRKRILAHSKLWSLISATETYQRIAHPGKFDKQNAQDGHTLKEEQYWDIQYLRLSQCRRGTWDRPVLAEAWKETEEAFRSLVASARAGGAQVAVLIIPDEVQVDAKKRAYICQRFKVEEKDYDLDQPQRRVTEIAASLNVPVADPLPQFRAEGSQGGLYLDFDTHWNAKGHALAARVLAPVVGSLLRR